MQRLTLTILHQEENGLGRLPPRAFDESGGTIGRAAGNDWVIPDPDRSISSRHCAVYFDQGSFYLLDMSANGVFLNDAETPIGKGASAKLQPGDVLFIGGSEISVAIGSATDPSTGMDPQAKPPQRGGVVPDILAGTIPELDWDREMGLADRKGEMQQPQIHSSSGAMRDNVSSQQEYFRPPSMVSQEFIPDDWDELAAASPVDLQDTVTPAMSGKVAHGRAARSAPTPAAPTMAASALGPVASPPQGPTGDGEFLHAFLQGAALLGAMPLPADAVGFLFTAGRRFREVAGGLQTLLQARTSVKAGMQLDATQFAAKKRNPFKDRNIALNEILQHLTGQSDPNTLPSLLSPDIAIEASIQDILCHELAMMAGYRAAIIALLRKFDPAKMEKDLAVLAGAAIADGNPDVAPERAWEQAYRKLHAEVIESRDPEGIPALCAQEFSDAYEAFSFAYRKMHRLPTTVD